MKLITTLMVFLGLIIALTAYADNLADMQNEIPAVSKHPTINYLTPRPLSTIPDNNFGKKIIKGYKLFVNSQTMRGKYVGNNQNCVNCHLDAGRKANSSPLWAAYLAYPAYRKKNDKINSFEDRLQGCFKYSMNGAAPESGSEELVALSAYSYWLTMGAIYNKYNLAEQVIPQLSDADLLKGANREDFKLPNNALASMPINLRRKTQGRGYPKLETPVNPASIPRGKVVYKEHCTTCHGDNGQGLIIANTPTIPPLWGKGSYNWGAGMHRINTAAYFIYENMPFGKPIQLTEQQAWDVAAFMNSHERPQDPRYNGNIHETANKYHNHQGYYGKKIAGIEVGTQAYPSKTIQE